MISCKIPECIGKLAAAMQGSNALSAYPGVSVTMNLQNLRRSLEPALRRIFHLYWRFARGMTLGVRAVVLDGENRVFLVKHSYISGWHLPGGGVEVGETFRDALLRELEEEGRIELTGEPALHGLFSIAISLAAIMSRSIWSGISGRIGCRSRTARLSRVDFSKPERCRRRRPRVHACGYRK